MHVSENTFYETLLLSSHQSIFSVILLQELIYIKF